MDKHKSRTRAPALLLPMLFLACFPLYAQCRLIEGTGDDKINIPGGLCVHHRDCKPGNCCFWCLVLDLCYASIGECKKECQGHIDARLFNLPSPSN
uniref:Embryo surrounding factor 1 brassicaceae domain-containing protein n=1 Tax=Aegilops tauschii subsp. strangulata TaxID=200361 RepID=A0A453DJF3_AEGTS